MRIYIAGKMTGEPESNYPAFNEAETALRAAGHRPQNPVNNDDGEPHEWEWYMRRALAMVLMSQAVALLPGWESSRGAALEAYVAHRLGMEIRTLEDWL